MVINREPLILTAILSRMAGLPFLSKILISYYTCYMKNGIFLILTLCFLAFGAQAKGVWICTQSGSSTDVIDSDDSTVCDNLCSSTKNYRQHSINNSRDTDTLNKYCAQTAGSPSDLKNDWLACECELRAEDTSD